MNKNILFEIVENILKSQEYDVTAGSEYGVDLVAKRGGHETFIRYGLTEDDLRHFADAAHGVSGAHKVRGVYEAPGHRTHVAQAHDALFISDRVTEWMEFFADQYKIRVWDRAEVESRIGRAVLAEAEGTHHDFLEVRERTHQHAAPAPALSPTPTPVPTPTLAPTSMPTLTPMPMSPLPGIGAVPVIEDSREVLTIRCAPIRVDEKQAIVTAKGFVSGITESILEFVPFWNYTCVVDGYYQYKAKSVAIVSEGAGAINALNNRKRERISEVQDQISIAQQNYEIKSAIATKDEVEKMLMEGAIESNKKTVSFTSNSGDTIITENRTIKPVAGDIKISTELVYLPVWEVRGRKHSVLIDAYDGGVMTEPVDDDIEFL